jgi:putative endonuclease
MRGKGGYVYIVSNKHRTVLYIGVTSNLYQRIYQHKFEYGSVFTKRYNCTDLVYYELFSDIVSAIAREKQLKKWKRSYKDELIKQFNPSLKDLFEDIEDFN